jgi:thymidylate synthase
MAAQGVADSPYFEMVRRVRKTGEETADRTGVGTISLPGQTAVYSLRGGRLPLLLTKRVPVRMVFEELMWFLRGETDAKLLAAKGVHIWDANATREFLDARGLGDNEAGDLGPVYGAQWRGTSENSVDQLSEVVRQLKEEPTSRRIILSAWNPVDNDRMALPPCHGPAQFIVRGTKEKPVLHCCLTQRSGDLGLGVPFNIASYGMLTHLLAQMAGMEAGTLTHFIGDAHIYLNHRVALREQERRLDTQDFAGRFVRAMGDDPVTFRVKDGVALDTVADLEALAWDDVAVDNYHPMSAIKMDMAV